ncbi:hypothetical protein ES708_16324 [subsurface metagenome]
MSFTVVAFQAARAAAIVPAAIVAGQPDEHVQVIGNDIIVPKFRHLIGQFAGHGVTAVPGTPEDAWLDSPSLRRVSRNEISSPMDMAVAPLVDNVAMNPLNPIPLDEGEALNAFLENTAVCAAGLGIVGAWLSDGAITPVKGEIRTIHATSVVAGTTAVWTNGVLALALDLPKGEYQCVGARVQAGATAGLFRLIFPEQWHRPGGVSTRVFLDIDLPQFRYGNLGVWGNFTHRVLPRLEVLNVETVVNPEIWLDCIKIA